MQEKVRRISNSFCDNSHDIAVETLDKDIQNDESQLEITRDILRHTKKSYKDYLELVNSKENADVSVFKVYKLFLLKEKAIHTQLNMLKQNNSIFTGLVYVPKYANFQKEIENLVQQGSLNGLTIEKAPDNIEGMTKPTLFKCNDFLWPFQEIVNTYGIPTYKEVNPAVFSVVSFPFLFGVMFGDIMHGTWLFVFATWLCFADKSDSNSLAGAMAPVRYLFLLMGFFSFYMGMIYNDLSSMPITIFGNTCFDKIEIGATDKKEFAHRSDNNCVHPFGMDPVWYRSSQEI